MNNKVIIFITLAILFTALFSLGCSDDVTSWTLVWSDEFDGPTIDTDKWYKLIKEAGAYNSEWQRYTADDANSFITNDNGTSSLVIKAIYDGGGHGENKYSSARLLTITKYSFKYGKIIARIKNPYGKGIWPAFWLLGTNYSDTGGPTTWPECGEIDIMEIGLKTDPDFGDGTLHGTIHYYNDLENQYKFTGGGTSLDSGKFADNYHIFGIEWDESKIIWTLDNKEFHRTDISGSSFNEFHEDFYIILNLAVGGLFCDYPNDTDTVFPQYMFVDWVRVYKKD